MGRFSAILLLTLAITSHGFEIQPRVVNGIVSNPSDFSFYAFVDSKHGNCGGTLISDTWVVTAAHCIENDDLPLVHLGIDSAGGFDKRINAQEKFVHPGYHNDKLFNDIGLIKLTSQPRLGGRVQVAKLPNDCRSMSKRSESVIVAGTGYYTLNGSEYRDDLVLRHANFTTISAKKCKKMISEEANIRELICVNIANNQTAYNGDSGGPLLHTDDGTLIGVMNFVTEYNDSKETDVEEKCAVQAYANIRYHYKWISHITGMKLPQCKRTVRDDSIFNYSSTASMLNMRLDDN